MHTCVEIVSPRLFFSKSDIEGEVRGSEIRRWEGVRHVCIGGLSRNCKLSLHPVNEEEKISKIIHVMRETSTLTWFFRGKDFYHKQRQGRREIEAEIECGK